MRENLKADIAAWRKIASHLDPKSGAVKLLTLDPGHFHAALVQKFMYPNVDPVVHVYGPGGPGIEEHLKRIQGFNSRSETPTSWKEEVCTSPDFFEKLLQDKLGNVVVISGNNAKKAKYILSCVQAGINVLADKPMAITPADFGLLEQAFAEADRQHVLLYDIMPERYEITTLLQRELSRVPELFGTLETGTPEDPAIIKESVHHFFKTVAGNPLLRPPWYFDVTQQGEGIVDVTTHLVDLVQWEGFPEQVLQPQDAHVLSARRWMTPITLEQFQRVSGCQEYPDYLKSCVDQNKALNVSCNGTFVYALRGVHAKVSVEWKFEAPAGGGDTHYSLMRGSKASLVIKQGQEQGYRPALYVEKRGAATDEQFEKSLRAALAKLSALWPGVDFKPCANGHEIIIPDKYKVGHEAHFAQVTEKYLNFLAVGRLPAWETPNMLTKYSTLMQAYRLSSQ